MRLHHWLLLVLLSTSPAQAQPRDWPRQPPQVEQRSEPPTFWQRLMRLLYELFGGDHPQWRGPFGDECLDPACRGMPKHLEPRPSRR